MAKKSGKTVASKKKTAAKVAKVSNNDKPIIQANDKPTDNKIIVYGRVPGIITLFKQTFKTISEHKALFAKIGIVYGLLSLIFQGQGLFSVNNLSGVTKGTTTDIETTLVAAVTAIGGAANDSTSAASGTIQFFLMLIVSLVLIYTLRMIKGGYKVRAKEAFYHSTTPLIPFMIILFVIALQMLPLLISASIYQILIVGGIVGPGPEQLIATIIFLLLVFPTFYWLISSVFAAYIVTLPDMTPRPALRSAKELVHKRRLKIFTRLIVLPLALTLFTAAIIIPVIAFIPVATQVVYFITITIAFLVTHTYMYTLYRGLLDE